MQTLGEKTQTSELFDIAARTTTVGTYGSKDIDKRGFDSSLCILNSAASSAGSSVTLDVKMQESDPVARSQDNSTGAQVGESSDEVLGADMEAELEEGGRQARQHADDGAEEEHLAPASGGARQTQREGTLLAHRDRRIPRAWPSEADHASGPSTSTRS